jgi:hypothetical protein
MQPTPEFNEPGRKTLISMVVVVHEKNPFWHNLLCVLQGTDGDSLPQPLVLLISCIGNLSNTAKTGSNDDVLLQA